MIKKTLAGGTLVLALLAPAAANCQTAAQPVQTQPAPVQAAPMQAATLKLPEGTEVEVSVDEKLTSATAQEGDRFRISLAEPITLNGVTIPAGYSGRGVIQSAKKKGFMGQAGQLNVSFDYIKIGDTKLRIRSDKGKEGQSHVGTTVVLTVLFGPLGLLKHGDDVVVNKGQVISAYLDEDALIALPLAAAPPSGD